MFSGRPTQPELTLIPEESHASSIGARCRRAKRAKWVKSLTSFGSVSFLTSLSPQQCHLKSRGASLDCPESQKSFCAIPPGNQTRDLRFEYYVNRSPQERRAIFSTASEASSTGIPISSVVAVSRDRPAKLFHPVVSQWRRQSSSELLSVIS